MTLPSVAAIGRVIGESVTPSAFSWSSASPSSSNVSGIVFSPACSNSAELYIEILKSLL